MLLLVTGSHYFQVMHLKSLIRMYGILNRSSSHRRNARSMRLVLLKLYIGVPQLHQLHPDKALLEKHQATHSLLPYIEAILKKAEKIAFYDE